MKPTVSVYTAGPGCMACVQTKRHLDKLGIAYTELPIDDDDNRAAALELGFRTAPVVVAQHSGEWEWQAWDGYRPDRIDALANS